MARPVRHQFQKRHPNNSNRVSGKTLFLVCASAHPLTVLIASNKQAIKPS